MNEDFDCAGARSPRQIKDIYGGNRIKTSHRQFVLQPRFLSSFRLGKYLDKGDDNREVNSFMMRDRTRKRQILERQIDRNTDI